MFDGRAVDVCYVNDLLFWLMFINRFPGAESQRESGIVLVKGQDRLLLRNL